MAIGARSVIGVQANLRAEGGKIVIGRVCLIAQNISLIAANHVMGTAKPYMDLPVDDSRTGVTIQDNVWLAAGVTVLPGVTIGANSVIGAGSVVTKSIPPNEIWAGVPARKLRAVA